MGAWIETPQIKRVIHAVLSLPSWERGLKRCTIYIQQNRIMSLPSWERGLKQEIYNPKEEDTPSLPSWERGLKPTPTHIIVLTQRVAPFMGAWIETFKLTAILLSWECRSLHGSVD